MIIFLNGASCSGKTTLARALQSSWDSPLIYLSLDAVISQLPFHYTATGNKAIDGFPVTELNDNGTLTPTIGIGEHGLKLNRLAAAHLRQLAESGYDVVVDYVLLNEDVVVPFRQALAELEVYFVGVMCEVVELKRRNQNRFDRPNGLSCAQQTSVHFCHQDYDLVVHSADNPVEVLVSNILQGLTQQRVGRGIGACD